MNGTITTVVTTMIDERFLKRLTGTWRLTYAYVPNDNVSLLLCDDGADCLFGQTHYILREIVNPDGKMYSDFPLTATGRPYDDLFMRFVSASYMATWESQEFPCIQRARVSEMRSRTRQLQECAERRAAEGEAGSESD